MVNFNKLAVEYADIAEFVVIYIAEAHPTDGWVLEGNVELKEHKCLQDRVEAAQTLIKYEPPPCPVLLDGMDGEADALYAALPERLFIVLDGKVVYHGEPGPSGYKLDEIENWLIRWRSSTK